MAEGGPGAAGGYVAFISYSHKDAAAGRWLHRRLESYRLPSRLVGTEGEHGEVPGRLTPIFRDREELPAAGDLSEKVRAALALSRNLIVICSPHSAASPWVAKEISTFRELHPDRPIFTAIVDGEPDQCFPSVLREGGSEPLAADLRKEGDGPRLGLLKLVAGLAGVGLDALVQRDAQRHVRRVTYVTAAAVAAMLVMALLTAFALNARADAERQRSEAEGLVEFMLTDLRASLKKVGRLDVLSAANQRVLQHYRRQDLDRLPADSLERRARLLHVMGDDDLNLGRQARADAEFREASRTTAALLAAEPDNPQRIFAQSQSEYWLGTAAYRRRNFRSARESFARYKLLTESLATRDPNNTLWLREAGFAEGSLCALTFEAPKDPAASLRLCSGALRWVEKSLKLAPRDPAAIEAVTNRHGWMMMAWAANGRRDRAREHMARVDDLLGSMIRSDPDNMDYRDIWMRSQFGIGEILRDEGHRKEARRRFLDAAATNAKLRAHDPENASWRSWQGRIAAVLDEKQG
jgi:hypothetical protein